MGVRSSTHVANAYSTDILAMVRGDTEKTEFEKIGVGGAEAERKYIYEYCEKNGYTKIGPHSFLRFWPEPASKRLNVFSALATVYVTIVTEAGGVVCKCFPVPENHSVIVDSNGYLQQTQMGTIWTDITGKVHK